MQKRKIPKFKSEADEAAWWYAHRAETARWLEEAAAKGQTTTLAEVLQRAPHRAGTLTREGRAPGSPRTRGSPSPRKTAK